MSAMTFEVHVEVTLRAGIADPEGATIERSLPALGFDEVHGRERRQVDPLRGRGRRTRPPPGPGSRSSASGSSPTRSSRTPASRSWPPDGRQGRGPALPGVQLRAGRDRGLPRPRRRGRADLARRPATSGGVDAVVVPGGFAHGDYLRPGAIARFSPVMGAVTDFAASGGPVVGICNGFQVLCEAGLLPGALQKNAGLRFLCRTVDPAGGFTGFGAHRRGGNRHGAAHPDQPLLGQLHVRAGRAGAAPGRRPDRPPVRPEPQRVHGRHRRRQQRGGQRRRPHAPPRAGQLGPARLRGRPAAPGLGPGRHPRRSPEPGPAGPGRRSGPGRVHRVVDSG